MCKTTVGANVKMKTRLQTNLCKKISLWQELHVCKCEYVCVCASAFHSVFLFTFTVCFDRCLKFMFSVLMLAHTQLCASFIEWYSNQTKRNHTQTKPNRTRMSNKMCISYVPHMCNLYARSITTSFVCVFNDWKISQRPQSQKQRESQHDKDEQISGYEIKRRKEEERAERKIEPTTTVKHS